MRKLLIPLTRNPISLAGTALMFVSAIIFATLLLIEVLGAEGNPYTGIITYLILPALAVLGFLLVMFGIRRERKRGPDARYPVLDLNVDLVRKRLVTLILVASVGVVFLAAATYEGFHVMESPSFCGETCHSVMGPEFAAYQRSPHARVDCVDCHIGSGTAWMVKARRRSPRSAV